MRARGNFSCGAETSRAVQKLLVRCGNFSCSHAMRKILVRCGNSRLGRASAGGSSWSHAAGRGRTPPVASLQVRWPRPQHVAAGRAVGPLVARSMLHRRSFCMVGGGYNPVVALAVACFPPRMGVHVFFRLEYDLSCSGRVRGAWSLLPAAVFCLFSAFLACCPLRLGGIELVFGAATEPVHPACRRCAATGATQSPAVSLCKSRRCPCSCEARPLSLCKSRRWPLGLADNKLCTTLL